MQSLRLTLFLLLLAPCAAFPADFANLNEARRMAEQAVGLFSEEKFVEGYDLLKPYWPLPAAEVDNMANQTLQQWPVIKARFGASLGVEFVSQTDVGNSLSQVIILQKFQNHAIRWVFVLYKPQKRWMINGVFFDDQLKELFP